MSFDLKVHHRDSKTGRLVKTTPYTLRIDKGKKTYERPTGSGNMWDAAGVPIGDHVEIKDELTEKQEFAAALVANESKISGLNEQLAAKDLEIAAIKAEADAKVIVVQNEKTTKGEKDGSKAGNTNTNNKKRI